MNEVDVPVVSIISSVTCDDYSAWISGLVSQNPGRDRGDECRIDWNSRENKMPFVYFYLLLLFYARFCEDSWNRGFAQTRKNPSQNNQLIFKL